jgi:hypothetical protein
VCDTEQIENFANRSDIFVSGAAVLTMVDWYDIIIGKLEGRLCIEFSRNKPEITAWEPTFCDVRFFIGFIFKFP